jgi:hypothetical protein
MNRRSLISAIPLLAFAPPTQAQPEVAEVVYGPTLATCPKGDKFWLIATEEAAFPIPDFEPMFARYAKGEWSAEQIGAVVMASGEWVLQDGWPHHWSHAEMRWVPLL